MNPVVHVVDDDDAVREGLVLLLRTAGHAVAAYASAEEFLAAPHIGTGGCLLLDMRLPGMDGLALQDELKRRGTGLPILFLTAFGDIPLTVRAMKAGAKGFLTKPVDSRALLEEIGILLAEPGPPPAGHAEATALRERLQSLTQRERMILDLAIQGLSNKEIARHLAISPRTVEVHRAHILEKTQVANLVQLARLVGIGDRLGRAVAHPPT